MITSWPLNVASASGVPPYMIDLHQTNSPSELNGKVTFSQSHSCVLTNWWKESQYPAPCPSTGHEVFFQICSIPASKLTRSRHPISAPNFLDYRLQTRSIAAYKFAQSWPPSAYLQTRQIMASKCISKLAQSQPPSVSPNSLDYGLQVDIQTSLITISECISKFTRSQPPSVSLNTLHYHLPGHR
jgi:hypothetical protein